MQIIDIGTDPSIKQSIDDFSQNQDNFESVLLIAIYKDGTQFLRSSKCSGHQKSFMISFALSWLMDFFKTDNN